MELIDAILLGAGSGTRFAQSEEQPNQVPKQFQLLEERPVFIWALKSVIEQALIRRAVIVIAPSYLDFAKRLLDQHFTKPEQLQIEFVKGGDRRQDSSLNAVKAIRDLNPNPGLILIHDACRPFLGNTLKNGLQAVSTRPEFSGWIPGVPVTDTIKQVCTGAVSKTVERSNLVRVQTPQFFRFNVLIKLLKQIESNSELSFTDDASMLEYFGEPVAVFSGDERNVKLTHETDAHTLRHYLKIKTRNAPCESELVTTFTV